MNNAGILEVGFIDFPLQVNNAGILEFGSSNPLLSTTGEQRGHCRIWLYWTDVARAIWQGNGNERPVDVSPDDVGSSSSHSQPREHRQRVKYQRHQIGEDVTHFPKSQYKKRNNSKCTMPSIPWQLILYIWCSNYQQNIYFAIWIESGNLHLVVLLASNSACSGTTRDATLTLLGESTFLSLSSPTIACLTIADRAKLNCHRRVIGFDPNSCLAFVNFLDILQNVEKWSEARDQ